MGIIGSILLAIILTVLGMCLGALLIYGLMTLIVYIEENK